MADLHDNTPSEFEPQAPSELIDHLHTLYATETRVPPAVDEAVLARARQQMIARRPNWILRWAVPPAAAAAVIMWVVFNPFVTPDRAIEPLASSEQRQGLTDEVATTQVAISRDIDGNGRVNILDALALARSIKANRVTDKPWDFNGDGVINRQDVDAVAQSAVRLNKGASS